ncbi:hypothetical protein TNCV_955841 [Trichonephila clavipes]|nr:hypothetical protein TNCV_955841 [Trichonephila clavipes]
MAPHKPRKSASINYTTDDEDLIMYDVEEEEPDPTDKFAIRECPANFPKIYLHALAPTRYRKVYKTERSNKTGVLTLGDAKAEPPSKTVEQRNLPLGITLFERAPDCASSLLPSIWNCDVRCVGTLLEGGRDFEREIQCDWLKPVSVVWL